MSLEKIINDAWEIKDQISPSSDPKLKDAINHCKSHSLNKKIFNETDILVTEFIIKSLGNFVTTSRTKKIEAIGYPGITVIHNPNGRISKTLGDSSTIAKTLKIRVVADFRQSDMKCGGQGAPVATYFYEYISMTANNFINFINLGGFANLTYR